MRASGWPIAIRSQVRPGTKIHQEPRQQDAVVPPTALLTLAQPL